MQTTQRDVSASLNDQHNTEVRGLGFREGPQTPSGWDEPDTARPDPAQGPGISAHRPADLPPSTPRWSLGLWGPPLNKALGAGALLVFVAYLGHVSDHLEQFGAVRRLDQKVIALADRWNGPKASAPGALAAESALSPAASIAGDERPVLAQSAAVDPPRVEVPPGCPKTQAPGPSALLSDGRLVLNEASVAELDALPGIGAARAEAIVALRGKLNGFKKLSDLLRIRGIGHKSFLKLKERLVLDRPLPGPGAEPAPTQDPPPAGQPVPISRGTRASGREQVVAAPTTAAPIAAAMMTLDASAEHVP